MKIATIYHNQTIRYCFVGGINTLVTGAVILILTTMDIGLYLSNAFGYVVGILFSFILNSYFTFASKPSFLQFAKFILCCLICYLINLIAMNWVIFIGIQNEYIIQIVGMIFYTAFGFWMNKSWVMQ